MPLYEVLAASSVRVVSYVGGVFGKLFCRLTIVGSTRVLMTFPFFGLTL